jgi:hypothetical protein
LYLYDNQLQGPIPQELGNLGNLQSLWLFGNQLTGPIPLNLTNLTSLGVNGLMFHWNALYSTDPILTAFLDAHMYVGVFGYWGDTQTVAPTDLSAGSPTTESLTLSWTPIDYTVDPGRYEVLYSSASWGPFLPYGTTADKTVSSMVVGGLEPGTTYYFSVRTITDPHPDNQNTVVSVPTALESGSTTAPLTITTNLLANALQGSPYSFWLTAVGGEGERFWSLASGSLPAGMSVDGSGEILGTPAAAGTYPITVQVNDDTGTVAKDLVLAVNHPNITFDVQPHDATAGDNIGPVTITLADSGGPIPGAWVDIALGSSPCPGATLLGGGTLITNGLGRATWASLSVSNGGWGYTLVVSNTATPSMNSTSEAFDVEGFCATGSMILGRQNHTASLLPNGEVLIAGGLGEGVAEVASAEIYDPVTGAFSSTDDMTLARWQHTSTSLADGRVLVAGGIPGASFVADVYDPETGLFSSTTGSSEAGYGSAATLLTSGEVLLSGTSPVCSVTSTGAELYDPAADGFTATTGALQKTRNYHTANLLADGRVFVVGGDECTVGGDTPFGELYDPTTGTFAFTSGALTYHPREFNAATLMPNGKVLVSGGGAGLSTTTGEIYDPAADSFTLTSTWLNDSRSDHGSVLLPNGRVLLTGGIAGATYRASAELYDLVTEAFSYTGSMTTGRTVHTTTVLENGSVLVTGGLGSGVTRLASAEIFYPIGGSEEGKVTLSRQYGTPVTDYSEALTLDETGVYVAGYTGGTLPGQSTLGSYDAFVRKYNRDGIELWTRQFGTSSFDIAWGMTAHNGSVYVVGETDGVFLGQSTSGGADAYIRKYDADGGLTWTRQFGSSSADHAYEVSVHSSGIYVAGYAADALPGETHLGETDAFVQKFDHDGTPLWSDQFGTSTWDYGLAIVVDDSGVYVAGYTSGELPGQTAAGLQDGYVRKYDHDGTVLWTDQFGTSEGEEMRGIALDSTGVYVVGSTRGAFPGETNKGSYDFLLRKYDHSGAHLFTRQFGSEDADFGSSIAVDASGIFVGGRTNGEFPGEIGLGGGIDSIACRRDLNGYDVWCHQFGGTSTDYVYGLAIDDEAVYISGRTQGTLRGHTAVGGTDAVFLKLTR